MGIRKGAGSFEKLPIAPTHTEVWRATETLLAPLGRAVTEASPSVDAKIPRQEGLPGGARRQNHPSRCRSGAWLSKHQHPSVRDETCSAGAIDRMEGRA